MKQSGSLSRASRNPLRAWLRGDHARAFALPAPLRQVPFALFVAGILAYGAAFAWYMLTRFDLVNLLRDATYDDAFYYFQIAYHMAEGKFSTFDGGLTRTNGYHPLWLFLITPFHWMLDKTEVLFAVKAFEIMLIAGGVALVAGAARVSRLPWILLFAMLPALYAQSGMVVGLEAALGLFTLGLLLLIACLFERDPARWRWPLAAVVFALPWARLEYVAIAMAVSAALCFLEWSDRREPLQGQRRPNGADAHPWRWQTAVPLAAAMAGILLYFVYNGIAFGGIVPVSGAVKELLSQAAWGDGGYSLAGNFHAFAQTEAFDDELLMALEICAYTLLVWWLSRSFRTREGRLLLAFMIGAFGLAAGHLAKFVQNVLVMHPFYGSSDWYFVPAYLMKALVVPVRCFVGIYVFRCALAAETRSAIDILCLAGGVAVGVALLAKADFGAPFRFVDQRSAENDMGLNLHSYMGVLALNRLLPKNASVGSRDSGLVGYFALFPVMNLDGLANSYDYKRAMENEPASSTGWSGLPYFANIFRSQDGAATQGWPLFETHASGLDHGQFGGKQFKLYGDSDVAAPPWNSIGSRFERQADGTGLLVQGRVAQAFAEECADEVAEWTFGGKVGAVSHWTRTVNGCASAVVLPRGHRPPVRVRSARLAEAMAGLTGGRPLTSRTNAAPGGFEVHLVGRRLVYAKEDCELADIETPVFLHLRMIDEHPEDGESAKTGHVNRDFWFELYGGWDMRAEGPCVADVPLPRQPIAAVRTGQQDRWEAHIPVDLERTADGVGSFVAHREAWAFAAECAANDVAAWTYLRRRMQGVDALGQTAGRGQRVRRRVLHPEEEKAISTWARTADGSCTSAIQLPLGHLHPVRVRRAPLTEALAGLGGGRPPAIGAASTHPRGFDVHLFVEDYARHPSCPNCSRTLIYAKEVCEQADVETPFFLHLVPAGNLKGGGGSAGFDSRDFWFEHNGDWSGEEGSACLAEVPLPEHDIARIRTGQYTVRGTVWEGEVRLIQPMAEALAGLTGGRSPVIRAGSTTPRGFDVYFVGDVLVYAKEACERADVETPFFLHLVPAGDDLDAGRESAGFNNRDFWFKQYGDWSGEDGSACLAKVPLPEYGIAKIRTGQYTAAGIAWEGEVHPHQLTTEEI